MPSLSVLIIAVLYVCLTYSLTDANIVTKYGSMHAPDKKEIEAALKKAKEINFLKRNIKLFDRNYGNSSRVRCPLLYHHGVRQYSDDTRANDQSSIALLAMRVLMEDGGYHIDDLQRDSEIFKRYHEFSCGIPDPSTCDFESKYRSADGSCNNVRNPGWGMAGNIQQRVLPNAYDDNLGLPRIKGLKNKELPNPRTVSNVVHRNRLYKETHSDELTLHAMGFGQFLDHDIAITPVVDVENCCEETVKHDKENCFNIMIPKSSDESSSIFDPGDCMAFTRSAPAFCSDDTSKGRSLRQQTNGLTSFIDCSNVYGSSVERQKDLREKKTGYRLATSIFEKKERILNGPAEDCILTDPSQRCSLAGDVRVNEVPTLTSYHYLLVKEHNRIAEQIKAFYGDNETIFQETRRILIAIIQKIVYDEFLPSIFSPEGLRKYKLQSSTSYHYNPKINPSLTNAFGIAYRVGHTWVPQQIQLFSESLKEINKKGFSRNTENTFLNPDMTYLPNAFERLSYFLSGRQSLETDNVLEEAIRSRLFINAEGTEAFDLAALNIQRGRDHGLPSYNEYRRWCKLPKVKRKWRSNGGLVDHTMEMRKLLEQANYHSPRDIDLFVGALTETHVPGGSLGPTFECIIGHHFQNLKFGDRFWYQNNDSGFTRDQISAIQSYSLSKLLCNNYNFKEIHCPNAFKSRDPVTSCNLIPDLDLSVFNPSTTVRIDGVSGWWKRSNINAGKYHTKTGLQNALTDDKGQLFGGRNNTDLDLNEDNLRLAEDNHSTEKDNQVVSENQVSVDEQIKRMINELEKAKEKRTNVDN